MFPLVTDRNGYPADPGPPLIAHNGHTTFSTGLERLQKGFRILVFAGKARPNTGDQRSPLIVGQGGHQGYAGGGYGNA